MLIYKGQNIRDKWPGLVSVKNVKRPMLPSRDVQMITAAGMVGAWLGRVKRGIRIIEADIRLLGDLSTRRQTAREIGAWLDDDTAQALSFDDEPDKTYYAILNGNLDFDESSRILGEFTLSFICADPYAYGLHHDVTPVSGGTVPNGGTADALPVFTLTSHAAQNSLTVTANGKTIKISRSLVANDVVVIDCKAHSVKLNGADAMSILTIDSRFITLPAGQPTTISWNGNMTVQVQYDERWK